jgi:hypothetical protein
MTRRERLERKAERLHGWAEKRETAAAAVFKAGEPFRGDTAFNTQPGHIPFRARLIAREDRAYESHKKAQGMESRAAGIERALDSSIYSDDVDAPERLAERIAELEAKRDRMKTINAAIRKGPGWLDRLTAAGFPLSDAEKKALIDAARGCVGEFRGFPAYALTNLGANIRRLQKRAEEVKRAADRAAKTEASGGVLLTEHPAINWCNVQFSEKPAAEVLDALRAAGYRWQGGAWHGALDVLPAVVREFAEESKTEPAHVDPNPTIAPGVLNVEAVRS